MKILMMTNTYTPIVGGVARSVVAFTDQFRKNGHRVLVVAPEFDHIPKDEMDVIRIPAIRHFNGSDFSVRLPIPFILSEKIERFQPDIIHSHHPFLLGDTALVLGAEYEIPVVFTHHTMYEQYTHYVPGDCFLLKRYVIELATGYANLCDHVIAPSESIRDILTKRKVQTPITVVPTGVDTDRFVRGDGSQFRKELGIDADAFVVGHIGRLAPEKNLEFLAMTVCEFLKSHSNTYFVVVGNGPSKSTIESLFNRHRIRKRLFLPGSLEGKKLVDAYHAMDVFAFASQTETQGMVLTEAMAAGIPVVALDAPGVREVVRDGYNGRLLATEKLGDFMEALQWLIQLPREYRWRLNKHCLDTAQRFSIEETARHCLGVYQSDIELTPRKGKMEGWREVMALIEEHWKIWVNRIRALTDAVFEEVSQA